MMLRISAIIFVAALCLSCNVRKTSSLIDQQPAYDVASGKLLTTAQVISNMNSDSNPYIKQYGPWDNWIAENIKVMSSGPSPNAIPHGDEDEILYTALDANGFLIPYIEFWRQREDFRSKSRDYKEFGKDRQWVYGVAFMDADLVAKRRAAWNELIDSYYPQIPGWLKSKDFSEATILPDNQGVILVLKSLSPSVAPESRATAHSMGGTDTEENDLAEGTSSKSGPYLELLTADGSHVSFANDYSWDELFGWKRPRPSEDSAWVDSDKYWDTSELTDDRYYILKNSAKNSIVAVYDYDGTKLESADPPRRDPHKFTSFTKSQINDLIDRQDK